jgi:hypothetical protein
MATNKPKIPKMELSKHPDFRVVHVNAFFGGLNPMEGNIMFYTNILEPKIKEGGTAGELEVDKVQMECQIDLRMSPLSFISLANWMNSNVKRMEELGLLKKEDIERSKQLNIPIV